MQFYVSGTDQKAEEYQRRFYYPDPKTFNAEAYAEKGRPGVAWHILGWECEVDEDSYWSGYANPTNTILAVMVGDDRVFGFFDGALVPIPREDYCAECGQMGCKGDGYDREGI